MQRYGFFPEYKIHIALFVAFWGKCDLTAPSPSGEKQDDVPKFLILTHRPESILYRKYRLGKEAQKDTGSNSRTDYAGHVGTHSVHQQVVGWIVLQAEVVGDSARHRHGRNSGVTDKRVDFLRRREEEIEELHEQHAGG